MTTTTDGNETWTVLGIKRDNKNRMYVAVDYEGSFHALFRHYPKGLLTDDDVKELQYNRNGFIMRTCEFLEGEDCVCYES